MKSVKNQPKMISQFDNGRIHSLRGAQFSCLQACQSVPKENCAAALETGAGPGSPKKQRASFPVQLLT